MQSMSISSGEHGGVRHNIDAEYRAGLTNVDPARTRYNEVLVNRPISEVYDERFGAALREYNDAQEAKGHPERRIASYLAKMRESKQEKASYEIVVQIGRMDTNPATDAECREASAAVYREFLERFRERYDHMDVVLAAIHQDEATPHLHVEYVPWCDGNKRGLSTKNGHTRAIRQMGFKDVEELNRDMFAVLEEAAARHGIQRVDMGLAGKSHRSVREFKQVMEESRQGGYSYNNDPRLVAVAAEAVEALAEADGVVEEQREFISEVAEAGKSPFRWARLATRAAELLAAGAPALERLRSMLAEWRAAMAEAPARWRECIINPVSDRLRSARWDEAQRIAGEEELRRLEEERERFARRSPAGLASAARAAAERSAGRGKGGRDEDLRARGRRSGH